jgi:hypothetical protein
MVVCSSHPSDIRKKKIGGLWSRPAWTKSESLFPKQPEQKWVGGVDQVVECLPCNCEALSSNSSITKNRKKKLNINHKVEHKL